MTTRSPGSGDKEVKDNLDVSNAIATENQKIHASLAVVSARTHEDSKAVKTFTAITTMYLPASLLAVSVPG